MDNRRAAGQPSTASATGHLETSRTGSLGHVDLIDAYLTAARLEQLASSLRARAQLTEAMSQALAWHSLAALVFRERAQALCLDLVRLSGALEGLSQTVRSRAHTS